MNKQTKKHERRKEQGRWGKIDSLSLSPIFPETFFTHVRRNTERTRSSVDSKRSSSLDKSATLDSSVSRPKLMQYIQQKAEMYELDDEIKNWERKIEIASISLSPEERLVLS